MDTLGTNETFGDDYEDTYVTNAISEDYHEDT